jgi:hypothetical protein
MVSIQTFRTMALALPGAEEKDHFGMPSFRVKNKIFATIHEAHGRAMIKLTPLLQPVFCGADTAAIYPVPGGWGRGGATFFELKKIGQDVLKDALTQAWLRIAPKKLAEGFKRAGGANGLL